MPGQPALELVPEGTMEGTPQPIVPDFVEPLGQHMLQKAADELQRWQGHGLPSMVLGILIAEADLAILHGENTAIGQRDPVDIATQVAEHLVGPLHGRFTVHDPLFGPHGLREGEIGPFLAHQIPEEASEEL
jgi:hypothetical protein